MLGLTSDSCFCNPGRRKRDMKAGYTPYCRRTSRRVSEERDAAPAQTGQSADKRLDIARADQPALQSATAPADPACP
jgi:hypothetical protein